MYICIYIYIYIYMYIYVYIYVYIYISLYGDGLKPVVPNLGGMKNRWPTSWIHRSMMESCFEPFERRRRWHVKKASSWKQHSISTYFYRFLTSIFLPFQVLRFLEFRNDGRIRSRFLPDRWSLFLLADARIGVTEASFHNVQNPFFLPYQKKGAKYHFRKHRPGIF